MKIRTATPMMTALLIAAAFPLAASAQDSIGVNAAIKNQVQMKTARDAALRPAVLREAVRIGDNVATGGQSSLQVLLRDQSVFTVGANARMTIDKFVYDPGRNSADMAATVAKGAFRFVSGKPGNAGTKTIATPGASIGIRGTMLEGVVGSDAAGVLAGEPGVSGLPANGEGVTLVILTGPGSTSSTFDKPGMVDVTTSGGGPLTLNRPGQAVVVIPGQTPFGPFTLSDDAMARLATLLASRSSGGGAPNQIGPVTLAAGLQVTPVGEAFNLAFEIPGTETEDRQPIDHVN